MPPPQPSAAETLFGDYIKFAARRLIVQLTQPHSKLSLLVNRTDAAKFSKEHFAEDLRNADAVTNWTMLKWRMDEALRKYCEEKIMLFISQRTATDL